ncbi:hypothetical protein [Massilibacterium senegalense]|uniref:hypothetical protein n=1 Tax=Massilibacterium senegalense TaxID=1632858 RepID=UPI00078660AA|nr:hypothetical protein [Massilibacterium senegalense]
MKRIFSILVAFCVFVGIGNHYVFAVSNSVIYSNNEDGLRNENNQQFVPLLNERVVNVLEKNNIDFHIENGYIIKLNQPSPELIDHVNVLLANSMDSEFQQRSMRLAASKYPTSWVYMKQYDRVTSKKFTKATKTAFVTAVTAWLTGVTGGAAALARAAGAGFGGYYFVESDTQNVYVFMKYYYRELGPGKVGPTGSYMGNYEIKKVERVTKSSKGSGGQVNTRYKKSTIVEPFF